MITPLGNKVIIKPEVLGEVKTEGGLFVQQVTIGFPKATVVAVSTDIVDGRIKAGDTVLFEPGAGTPIEDGLVVNYGNIVGVVTEETA